MWKYRGFWRVKMWFTLVYGWSDEILGGSYVFFNGGLTSFFTLFLCTTESVYPQKWVWSTMTSWGEPSPLQLRNMEINTWKYRPFGGKHADLRKQHEDFANRKRCDLMISYGEWQNNTRIFCFVNVTGKHASGNLVKHWLPGWSTRVGNKYERPWNIFKPPTPQVR